MVNLDSRLAHSHGCFYRYSWTSVEERRKLTVTLAANAIPERVLKREEHWWSLLLPSVGERIRTLTLTLAVTGIR